MEKKERQKAKILYQLFDADSFGEDFFAILHSRAPEDQQLCESSVEPDEGSDKSSLVTEVPLLSVRKRSKVKKTAPSSRVKKSTPKTPQQNKPKANVRTASPPASSAIGSKSTFSHAVERREDLVHDVGSNTLNYTGQVETDGVVSGVTHTGTVYAGGLDLGADGISPSDVRGTTGPVEQHSSDESKMANTDC